ncbi:MAG: serine/threonine protein kinase [Planctomycetes bacterium]|nr:serine/threonine protein kinase [Planctomycetota bacterium]
MTWTRERWTRIEAAFHEVAELPGPQRAERLVAVCGDDDDLRRQVQRLLAADASPADPLLDAGIGTALRGHDPLLGRRFGAWELVERIAEGGMGTVYRAERRDGDFEQEVAVKVLRLGLSSPGMRDRFARERQTLARIVHGNVARLLDGGTTEQGVPFIAMELVDGVPIDRFCDQQRASLRTRLALFAAVCRAVQFAHQNLVAHLDLKPANILVDAHGVPKLVDFGVAALLQAVGDGGGPGSVAVTRSRPLTPEYASPELLRGEPVGTGADVWSLGAVLYELLTGVRAFRPTRSDYELARVVSETDAARPSDAFADAAAAAERARCRAASGPELARLLRGDLDRIVQKALRRDVAARYASCRDLADDIERHLAGFPVAAREPSFGYRAHKFVVRHRLAVAAVTAVVVALVGGLWASLHLARVATRERDATAAARREAELARDAATVERDAAAAARAEAESARDRAEHEALHARVEAASSYVVAEFLGDTFLSGRFLADAGQRDAALATIRRKAEQVRRQHDDDVHLRANLLHALGRAALRVGAAADAEALLREAGDLRRDHFGADSLEYALSLGALGQFYYGEGRLPDALTALREAYRLQRECPHDVHTDIAMAANDLGAAERAAGNRDRARELHEEALALRRASDAPELVAESLNNLANCEVDPAAARRHLDEALQLRRQVFGADDPLTLQSASNLAACCLKLGQVDAARTLLVDVDRRALGLGALGHEARSAALRLLAWIELQQGDAAAAEAAIGAALALDRQRLGDGHAQLAAPLEIEAKVLERQARWPEACDRWAEVLRLRRGMLPADHRLLPLTSCSLGLARVRAGDVTAGLAELRAAAAALAGGAPADRVDAAVCLALGEEVAGEVEAAERRLRAALQTCRDEPAAAGRRGVVEGHLRELLRRRSERRR